jgi:hypothetical protein
MPEVTAEFSLLLRAASPAPARLPQGNAPDCGAPALDWERLLALASRHGVGPLLGRWLDQQPALAAPATVLAEMRRQQQTLALHNLRLTGELWTLLELFAAHGIEALPLKGPTLAMLAFGDLAGRSFGDLDILVAGPDVARASDLLQGQGYVVNLAWAATQDERFLAVTYDLEFFHRKRGLMVELHWALFPHYLGFGFELDGMRRRLSSVRPGGKPMRTLAPDDLLLYLCAHAAKHQWAQLKAVADVAWLLEKHASWDWPALLAAARAQRLEHVFLLGMLLAKQVLGAAVPAWIEQRALATPSVTRLAEQSVLDWQQTPPPAGSMWRQFRYFYHLQQDWRARLWYGLRLLMAPNVGDWEFLPLARRWHFLYLFLRPLRLLLSR